MGMKTPKNNAKSVRMTDEVLAYIWTMEGNGFNEKFENMVLFAMKTEDERKDKIKQLDDEIRRKKSIVHKLWDWECRLKDVESSLKRIEDTISPIVDFDDM
nr:hypothetical protein [uncultured Blautia sp.]